MALPVSLDSKSTALWTWTLAPPPDFLPLPFPPFFIFAGPARSDHSSATAFLPSVASLPPRSASAALATSFPHDARAFWRSEGRDRSQGQGRRRAKKVEVTLTFLMSSGRFPLKTSLGAASAPSPGALVPGPARPFVLAFAPMIAYHSSKRIHHHGQPRAVSPFPPRRFRGSFFLFFWWTFPGGNFKRGDRKESSAILRCGLASAISKTGNLLRKIKAARARARAGRGLARQKASEAEERSERKGLLARGPLQSAWVVEKREREGRVPSRAAVTSFARKGRGVCALSGRRDETRRDAGRKKKLFFSEV